jgi:glycosyltransferase involved in cell wall biosynthesis
LSEIHFSIIIACYNQEAFIKESVESALPQRYLNKEIILVNDCSSDGTVDVLKTFGTLIKLVILPKHSGAYTSRDYGACLATGKYLVFLDSDDVLMPLVLDVYDELVTVRCPKIALGQAILFNGKVPETNIIDISNSIKFVKSAYFLAKDRSGLYNISALVVDRSYFWSAGRWSHGIFYKDIQDL